MVEVKAENFCFSYPNGKKVLKNINLEIQSGEFVVLCGKSGSGKTTLLKMLKKELSPVGQKSGKISLFGKDIDELSLRKSATKIGFLLQNPEFQIVTHTVRSELAFGLENLGLDSGEIRLRIAEIASYFSLSSILDKKISELSGGQKQLLCLASVSAMHPSLLILDEPTAQLDPMSAALIIDTALKLCRENALTVIISEHRLENLIPCCDRVIVMENGEILCNGKAEKIAKDMFEKSDFVRSSMPVSMKLHCELGLSGNAPLTVSEGREMLSKLFQNKEIAKKSVTRQSKTEKTKELAVKVKNLAFAYNKSGYILSSLNLKIPKGEFFALLGENGAGKTTAMKLMCGLLESKKGKIELFGKDIKKYSNSELYHETVAMLSQNCENLFAGPTIREDFENLLKERKLSKEEREQKISEVSRFFEIESLIDCHPYDVSGGELQRSALAMVLLREVKILFLDEPTKGMDNLFKEQFAKKIKELCKSGITVVAVSHDTEFCAKYCDECALIFDGICAVQKDSREFFADNFFYTTASNKISRHLFENAVTESEVLELCREN